MDKVFITGTSGYIGGSILAQLVKRGNYQITAVVRSLDAVPKDVAEKINLVQGDIYDFDFVREVAKGHNIVIHNVKAGGFEKDLKLINILGEEARYATRDRPGVFLYTSGVYTCGSGIACEKEEINEDMPAPSISSWGRKQLEDAVLTFSTINLSAAAVRPGWVFGGALKHRSLFQNYISYSKKHSVIPYIGDLQTLIPTIHVDDLVNLHLTVLDHRYNGVYTGTDKSQTLEHLLQTLSAHTKLPVKESNDDEFKKLDFAYAMDRSLSINAGNLYARKTGWTVQRPLSQSLNELFD